MPEVPFKAIHEGDGSYEIPGGIYAVRDQPELEEFWARLEGRQHPTPAPPVVNWGDTLAVFVLLGTRATPGYRLRIERVIAEGAGVRVFAVEMPKRPEWVTTQNLTAPYQMITVPRFNGTAELTMEIDTEEP